MKREIHLPNLHDLGYMLVSGAVYIYIYTLVYIYIEVFVGFSNIKHTMYLGVGWFSIAMLYFRVISVIPNVVLKISHDFPNAKLLFFPENKCYCGFKDVLSLRILAHRTSDGEQGVYNHLRNERYLGSIKPFSVSVIRSLRYVYLHLLDSSNLMNILFCRWVVLKPSNLVAGHKRLGWVVLFFRRSSVVALR